MRYFLVIGFLLVSATVFSQQKSIYYPSGFVHYSYNVKNQKLDGEFASYYENGMVSAKGSFSGGQKTGKWQAWDSSGVLRTSRLYRNNADFDLLAEWTADGTRIEEEKVKKKNETLKNAGLSNDVIYVERYWKRILPGQANEELFWSEFRNSLIERITSKEIYVFQEDRFVHVLSPAEATAQLKTQPASYLIKEQHSFLANNQQMQTKIIGVGMAYYDGEKENIYWLYYPDMEPVLLKMPVPAPAIAARLSEQSFVSEIDMTTYLSRNFQARKVSENEKNMLLLREADFEAQAWIYLLNKELLANR